MERFDIYLRGFTGSEPAEVGLQRAFGLDPRRAAELVRSLPRVVKRDVPGEQAARYQRALSALGADFELRRSPIRPQPMISVAGPSAGSGGTAPSDDLDLPARGWSQPPPAAAPAAVAEPVRAQPARSLAATWSESRPPPRGPNDTDLGRWPPSADSPALAKGAQARDESSAHGRALAGTLREARPPSFAPAELQVHPRAATLPESQPPPPYRAPPSDRPPPAAEPPWLTDELPTAAGSLSLAPPAAPTAPLTQAADRPPPAEPGLGSAWSSLELDDIKPAPVGGPPAAWRAGALDVDLRSGYLLDNQAAFERGGRISDSPAVSDPFDPPPSLAPVSRKPPRAHDPGAFAVQWSGMPDAYDQGSPVVTRAQPTAAVAVGLVAGRETIHDEPPALLRWLIRAGMGLSLFVIVTTVRHCHALETGVDDALAGWGQRTEQAPDGKSGSARATPPSALGPPAVAWLESDFHMVSNGDKDRIRGLAQRLENAGAAGVYVGAVTSMGMTKVAGELIVQLPADAERRKAVLDVYDQYMAAQFGGLEVAGAAPKGDLLRITF